MPMGLPLYFSRRIMISCFICSFVGRDSEFAPTGSSTGSLPLVAMFACPRAVLLIYRIYNTAIMENIEQENIQPTGN